MSNAPLKRPRTLNQTPEGLRANNAQRNREYRARHREAIAARKRPGDAMKRA